MRFPNVYEENNARRVYVPFKSNNQLEHSEAIGAVVAGTRMQFTR